jgi:hypothetical protein
MLNDLIACEIIFQFVLFIFVIIKCTLSDIILLQVARWIMFCRLQYNVVIQSDISDTSICYFLLVIELISNWFDLIFNWGNLYILSLDTPFWRSGNMKQQCLRVLHEFSWAQLNCQHYNNEQRSQKCIAFDNKTFLHLISTETTHLVKGEQIRWVLIFWQIFLIWRFLPIVKFLSIFVVFKNFKVNKFSDLIFYPDYGENMRNSKKIIPLLITGK